MYHSDYIDELVERIDELKSALRSIKRELTIPAAEYVPAIPVVWRIIDAALNPAPTSTDLDHRE